MKKTAVVIQGDVNRANGVIQTQLYNIGANCRLKVVYVILTPNWPADEKGKTYSTALRQFQISTNLISRPSYSGIGVLRTDETPLMVFLSSASKVSTKIVATNPCEDFFDINNSSSYCNFKLIEIEPLPVAPVNASLNWWYHLTMYLAIETPD